MRGTTIHIGPRDAVEGTLETALRVLERSPDDALARQRAAESLARLGRPQEAIAHYTALIDLWARQGRLLRAIAIAHRILALDPAHAATQSKLADLVTARIAPSSEVDQLAHVPLFGELDRDAFVSILGTLGRRAVKTGETILEEGEPGDAMYVVAQGKVRVQRRGAAGETQVIDEMGEGDFFGEMALVTRGPRFATVIAITDGELLVVERERLDAIVRAHPSVGAVVARFHKQRLLLNVLRASSLFGGLSESMLQTLIDVFQVQTHPEGTILLEEKKPGKGLFVLLRGECDVFHTRDDGTEAPYPTMREGDVFGELSLLRDGIATATVRTRGQAVVLELKREWFDELLLANPDVRERIYALAGERAQRTHDLLEREALKKRLV